MKFTAPVLVLLLLATPAQAQQLDPRWSPWLGCWQLSGENVRVCVASSPDAAGVTLSTYVDNAAEGRTATPVLAQALVADGARHSIAEAECRGWQQADWSRTGERLFARAELTCGDTSVRTVSGISMITGGGIWIDIQGIAIAGRENIRVRRYRRANGGAAAATRRATALAPRLGAAGFTIEDVKEASARLSPRVMEAALVETNAGFDLNSRMLVDLDGAGVADSVIDTMVALSYPRHFIVERPAGLSSGTFPGLDVDDIWWGAWPFPYYPSYWGRYDLYSPALYSPYLYSPFGYAYWGSYGGFDPYGAYYFPGAGFVPINIDASENGGGGGRAVNGVGYTRIRKAEAEPTETGRRTGDSTASSGTSSTRGDSSTSSSGSSGVSSSGFSSGSSSGDTGRTAQPR